MEHNIQIASLKRFAAGTATREEARAIASHLLRECPVCVKRLQTILQPSVAGVDYSPALDSFIKACLGAQPKGQDASRLRSEPSADPEKRPRLRPWQ